MGKIFQAVDFLLREVSYIFSFSFSMLFVIFFSFLISCNLNAPFMAFVGCSNHLVVLWFVSGSGFVVPV